MSGHRSWTWQPNVASRLAALRSEMATSAPGTHIEIRVSELQVETHVGLDDTGSCWVRIACDPSGVSVDDRSALISFVTLRSGYRVIVGPEADERIAASFLDDMVTLVNGGHPPGDAGRAALSAWRDLLAKPAGGPLSKQAIVGLFGELSVLEAVVRAGGQLEHWTGWQKDHNDFRLPGLAIEVKATTSANYRRVRIHGLRQLDDPEDGSDLVLLIERLEASATGRSVPDLIQSIIDLGAPAARLFECLTKVDYYANHEAQYADQLFVSEQIALRRVDDGHPRLIPSMLAGVDTTCIDSISYELNLNGEANSDLSTDLESLLTKHLRP